MAVGVAVCRRAVQNGFAPLGWDMLYDPVPVSYTHLDVYKRQAVYR